MNLFRDFFSKERKKEKELLYRLKKNISQTPTDIVSRRTLGDLYLKTNNKTEAVNQFIWIADHYRREEFYIKAIAMYKRIVKIDVDNEKCLFDLADVYVNNKMKTEAASIYRKFIDKAKIEKNSDRIIELLNKVIFFDKNNIILRIEKASELLKSGDSEQAVLEYLFIVKNLFAIEKFEEIEKLLLNTGIIDNRLFGKLLICYIEQDKLKKGMELIKKQKLENLDNIEILGPIIDLYLKKKSIKYALKINKKIFKKDPKAVDMLLKIAVFHLSSKKYDEAYDYLLPILDENIYLKNYNGAIDMLDVFLNYKDDFVPALKKLSSVYKIKEDTSALIKHLERLIPLYKKNDLKNDLKIILEELVEISDTPFTYKHQLADISEGEKFPISDDELNEGKEFLDYNNRLLDECLIVNDYDNAIKISNKIIAEYPVLIEPKINLMAILEKSGNLSKALEMARDTISLLISEKNQMIPEIKGKGLDLEDTAIDFEISDIDVKELIIDLSEESDMNDEIWESRENEPLPIRDSY